MGYTIPIIDTEFFCIADRKHYDLAAIVSSYLAKEGIYLPMFEFLSVTEGKKERNTEELDKHTISHIRSNEFDVRVGNCLKALQAFPNIILIGLSEDQKSYLSFLTEEYNIIEILSYEDIELCLGAFALDKNEYVICNKENISKRLAEALLKKAKLKLGNEILQLQYNPDVEFEGIVIIEAIQSTSAIVALNYAYSIRAKILLIEPLLVDEEKEIEDLLATWKGGSMGSFDDLKERILFRIRGIDFEKYHYATFFTEGLPYSILINDIIFCSYVHLSLSPDLFIFNNLYSERKAKISSAVVFSPREFIEEETEYVIKCFENANYHTIPLVGKAANVFNLEMHITCFPYDFFHICSHGGEVDGTTISAEFEDDMGGLHTVEFDQVLSFAINPFEEKIGVLSMQYFRKFDGMRWKSRELKELNLPEDLFVQMHQVLRARSYSNVTSIPNDFVIGSHSIKCSDFNYLATFTGVVASTYTAPIIFNNSCWSWIGIADFFLSGGVRGYIGTLWNIKNDSAIKSAQRFYEFLFEMPIIEAVTAMNEVTKDSIDENVYIYWGLHFTTLKKGKDVKKSKRDITEHLLTSISSNKDNFNKAQRKEMKEGISRVIDWIKRKLKTEFLDESVSVFIKNGFLPQKEFYKRKIKQPRNTLCFCGSGKKYKRCHGN